MFYSCNKKSPILKIDFQGVIKLFEIKKPSASSKTIRIPTPLIERLEELAEKNNISFNQLVIQCCDYVIKHLKRVKGEK